MSINACTIDASTVNTFCSPRRGIVFNNLSNILHPTTPPFVQAGSSRVLRDTSPFAPQFEIDDQPIVTFEQPEVTISVELFGVVGTETQNVAGAQADFVTVTNLTVDGVEPIVGVNITDLTFE